MLDLSIPRVPASTSSLPLAERTFRLIRRAGSGGFGSVWKALSNSGKTVALKWAHTSEGAPELAREVEIASLALSPRLPELSDAGWALVPTTVAEGAELRALPGPAPGARPFIALSWVEGEPLDQRTPTAAAVDEALALAADAAEALADLHAMGTAHGDVKPQNLLTGAAGRVHVIDLGLSGPAFSTDISGATLRYLARGDADLGDARARDLLALGTVLAELVAPEVRAAADPIAAARAAALPAPLDEICGALLSRSPTARASASWVAGAAHAARGTTSGERAERDARAVRASYLRLRRHDLATASAAAPDTAP
jgi:serine/threonine-protein kinase PknK